jgi:hypothetical protein
VALADRVALAEPAVGVHRNCLRAATAAEATGHTTRSIAGARPIATGLPPIDLGALRAAILWRNGSPLPASESEPRAAIWPATVDWEAERPPGKMAAV